MRFLNIIKLTFLLSLLTLLSCEKDTSTPPIVTKTVECKPVQLPQQIRQFNAINPNASAGSNPVFATLKLSQDLLVYKDTKCNDKIPVCGVKLFVRNNDDRKIIFDYTILFESGSNTWQYQGVSSLLANDTNTVGIISSNCGWIQDAKIDISIGHIAFQ